MEKLLWIFLVAIFFTGCDCKAILNGENISEASSDGDEKCSKGMNSWKDYSIGFLQSSIDRLFSSNKEVESKFFCFSRKNVHEPCNVTINANFTAWDANGCDFDTTVKTIFIIHGFKGVFTPWTKELKDALILQEDCNVCIVECGHLSETYREALKNTPKVGKQVSHFIFKLMESKCLDPQNVHIIGHSVGAHAAGFAGKEIRKKTQKLVGRITGLDPAGPGLYGAIPEKRLDATDASFVDVIHTNGGCSRLEGSGLPDAVGHFDFYPNGGKMQPGCLTFSEFLGEMDLGLAKRSFKSLFGTPKQSERGNVSKLMCSHIRSHAFFTASVWNESCKFLSVQCSSWNRYVTGHCDGNEKVAMGYYADRHRGLAKDGRRKFYLETTANSPYC